MWYLPEENPDCRTDRTIKVLRKAHDRAAACHHRFVMPEHVLWALAMVEPGIGIVVLERLGFNLRERIAELEALTAAVPTVGDGTPEPSLELMEVLKQAKAEATRL